MNVDATSPSAAGVSTYEALYQLLTNSLKAHERSPVMISRSQLRSASPQSTLSSIADATAVLRLFDGPTETTNSTAVTTNTERPGARSPRADAAARPDPVVSAPPAAPLEDVTSGFSLAPPRRVWQSQRVSPLPEAAPFTTSSTPTPSPALPSNHLSSGAASSSSALPPLASTRSTTSSSQFSKPPKPTGTKKSDETTLLLQVIEEQRAIIEKLVQSNEALQQQLATHQQRMDAQDCRFREQEARLASAEAALVAQRQQEHGIAATAGVVDVVAALRPKEASGGVVPGAGRSSSYGSSPQACETAAQTLPMTRSSSSQTAIGWSGRLRSPSRDDDTAADFHDDGRKRQHYHDPVDIAARSRELPRSLHCTTPEWNVPTRRRGADDIVVAEPLSYHSALSAVPCAFTDHPNSLGSTSRDNAPSSRVGLESRSFRSPRRTTGSPQPRTMTATEALWTLRYSPFLSREAHSRVQHLVGKLYGID